MAGASWDAIADELGRGRTQVLDRAQLLGVHGLRLRRQAVAAPKPEPVDEPPAPPEPEKSERSGRDALPPGHQLTWRLITAGTVLEGCLYGDDRLEVRSRAENTQTLSRP